jgi:hypothetical protein
MEEGKMKRLLASAAALVALGFAGNAYAFHSGGVADCEGCHTMHNSFEGGAIVTNPTSGLAQFAAGPYLLKGSDQSSACLNCHQNNLDTGPSSYHVSTNMSLNTLPLQRGPGGDFGWLKKSYTFADRTPGQFVTNAGERHGHNIVAADYGYDSDPTMAGPNSPGGSYPINKLACSSCHDPHGKTRRDGSTTGLPIVASGSYPNLTFSTGGSGTSWGALGAYRILRGPAIVERSTGFNTAAPPPVALAPSTYNRSESASETIIAYGSGMSEWCASCHGSMLQAGYTSGMKGTVHPVGATANLNLDGSAINVNYANYVASGNLTGTIVPHNGVSYGHVGYSSLVPFESGATDAATLQNAGGTAVVTPTVAATSRVLCLSCHRAHAGGFESMVRYSLTNEFMTLADTAGNPVYPDPAVNRFAAYGMPVADQQAAYYDRDPHYFAPYQRNYCNKCHAKD